METYQCLMLEKEGASKMAIGKFLKGIGKDIKKGLKGSKEYQEGKARRKAKRAKSPLGKAAKQVSKDVKSALKGSKEYQAGKAKRKAVKAKKKEGKTWTKAVKEQKKAGGPSMNELIKQRNAADKGSAAYAKAQNAINKAYGSKKVHKSFVPGSEADVKGKQKEAQLKKEGTYAEGGKVESSGGESNPYGWPSRDARNGGNR